VEAEALVAASGAAVRKSNTNSIPGLQALRASDGAHLPAIWAAEADGDAVAAALTTAPPQKRTPQDVRDCRRWIQGD